VGGGRGGGARGKSGRENKKGKQSALDLVQTRRVGKKKGDNRTEDRRLADIVTHQEAPETGQKK